MNQRVKRTQRNYTLAFKQSVVDQVEGGEMTYKQAQARYGIRGVRRYYSGCVDTVTRTGALVLEAAPPRVLPFHNLLLLRNNASRP
jgi:hypothetical protein